MKILCFYDIHRPKDQANPPIKQTKLEPKKITIKFIKKIHIVWRFSLMKTSL